MSNYREIGVIKSDLDEYASYVTDSRFSEEQKIKFASICGDLQRELRRERSRLYQKRKAAEKKAACK